MTNQIYPCLWFDNNAEEAAHFYCSVFKSGVIKSNTPIVVNLEMSGQKFMFLNGGPHFKINPSISFYVICETEDETRSVWSKLVENGMVMMPIDKYDWSEMYGWLQDRYGVSWQITFGKIENLGQKITPAFLFTNKQYGRAEEAVRSYTSIFKNSTIDTIFRYDDNHKMHEGKIAHSQIHLLNLKFIMMDSGVSHDFSFTEALSLVIECKTQHEIDYYWTKLSEDGEEGQCGWLKDKFGVSWQVVPTILSTLMSDTRRAKKVTEAFMKMKKFDIEKLLQA